VQEPGVRSVTYNSPTVCIPGTTAISTIP
jgi:hypothetical protein